MTNTRVPPPAGSETLDERCPWCDHPIPHKQFEEIQKRIEARDRRRTAEVEAQLKTEIEKVQQEAALAIEKARSESAAAAEEATKVRLAEMAARMADAEKAKVAAEKRLAVEMKAMTAQVAAAVAEGRKAAAAELSAKLADAEKAKVAAEKRLAAEIKTMKAQVKTAAADGKEAAEAQMALQLVAAQKAKEAAETQLATLKESQEGLLTARVEEMRGAFEKDKLKAVNEEKARAFKERQKTEEKLQLLQRQLKKQTANELGEGAEIDLFDQLKSAFPDDQFRRVKKGEPGADIIHTVRNKGRTCGTFVYDSKNRAAWRTEYATKLRQDQIAAQAEHAILVCYAFPAGARQLHVQDGVILANPARVETLVALLRDHMIQLATLRLTNEARAQKTARLYEFITSEHCSQLFDQIDSLADQLLALDVQEKKTHDSTWRRRGELTRLIQQARGSLVSEIDLITAARASHLKAAT